jgi:prepilin-type N-terminal cleavage/methylation domain-containing protein
MQFNVLFALVTKSLKGGARCPQRAFDRYISRGRLGTSRSIFNCIDTAKMRLEFRFLRRPARLSRAFSLIEVVVAIGIFAVGMVAVLGLFTPIARSVSSSADAEVAARVADALRVKMQSLPFATVAGLLKESTSSGHQLAESDARSDYDITRDTQLLFANRDGSKIGLYTDAIWIDPATKRNSDREKFFEIALIRNEAISPKASNTTDADGAEVKTQPDTTAAMLAYTARLRWPAFISDGGTGAIQFGANPSGSVRFDHSKKQVLYIAGSITR